MNKESRVLLLLLAILITTFSAIGLYAEYQKGYSDGVHDGWWRGSHGGSVYGDAVFRHTSR